MKKTLVLGGSTNPQRYSNLAIRRLLLKGYEVISIGKQGGEVEGVRIEKEKLPLTDVHTVTVYLNASNQKRYYDYIISLKPKRVIFNPGAENSELEKELNKNGIETEEACTLTLLSTGQF